MRPRVWSLALAGVCLSLPASASLAAGPARTAAVTFAVVGPPVIHNVQGDKLVFNAGGTSGSADYSTKASEGGAQWKVRFTWKVPQTIVAGTKLEGAIQLGVAVSNVQPEQPLSQGIKGFAPGFAEQIIASYPSTASASKTYDYTLSASQTTAFTITIELLSSTVVYQYKPLGGSCRALASATPGARAEACLESFRFSAGANHPTRVRPPTGRTLYESGWALRAGGGRRPHLSYIEGVSRQDPGKRRGALVDLEVTDTDLRTSGPAKVVKLDVVVEKDAHGNPLIDKVMRCRKGSRGTIVLIDDDRLLPGGEASREETRDKVIVRLPACPYFAHTYSNADSFVHEPYVGGQWAKVIVKTSG